MRVQKAQIHKMFGYLRPRTSCSRECGVDRIPWAANTALANGRRDKYNDDNDDSLRIRASCDSSTKKGSTGVQYQDNRKYKKGTEILTHKPVAYQRSYSSRYPPSL